MACKYKEHDSDLQWRRRRKRIIFGHLLVKGGKKNAGLHLLSENGGKI